MGALFAKFEVIVVEKLGSLLSAVLTFSKEFNYKVKLYQVCFPVYVVVVLPKVRKTGHN